MPVDLPELLSLPQGLARRPTTMAAHSRSPCWVGKAGAFQTLMDRKECAHRRWRELDTCPLDTVLAFGQMLPQADLHFQMPVTLEKRQRAAPYPAHPGEGVAERSGAAPLDSGHRSPQVVGNTVWPLGVIFAEHCRHYTRCPCSFAFHKFYALALLVDAVG